MKLKKPFNQNRNIFQSVVGASRYRLLSIFMAALIFCGMNSQLLAAASLNLGANIDANNNASASGDKFNSESFLKASNPNADDHQHWTWGEEIGAVILGAALLGGAVAGGYKCYADRNARMGGSSEAPARLRESTDGSDERQTTSSGSWSSYLRDCFISKAADSTIADGSSTDNLSSGNEVVPGWRQKGAQLLASLGQGAYDLATLKSCLPVETAPEKPIMTHLAEFRENQLKKKLADHKAQKSWGQFIYDLVTLKSDKLPSALTQRQEKQLKMTLLGEKLNSHVTLQETRDFINHSEKEEERKKTINALNPEASLDDMYAVLDPEVKNALNELMGTPGGLQESNQDFSQNKKPLYFVAKDPDVENSLREKLLKAIDDRWSHDSQVNSSRNSQSNQESDQYFDQNKKLLYFVAKDPEVNLGHIEAIKEVLFPVSNQLESSVSETVIVDNSKESIDSSVENPLSEKPLKATDDCRVNDNQVNSSRNSQSNESVLPSVESYSPSETPIKKTGWFQ